MSEPGKIFELLPLVMREIGGIGKGQRNAEQRYNFRGIDDALNCVGPILSRHGVTVAISVEERTLSETVVSVTKEKERVNTRCNLLMAVTFWAPDGSHVTNRTAGEGQDYGGDKATNKAMAAAFKYALFFGLVIPIDAASVDDSDRDAKEEERTKPQPAPVEKTWVQKVNEMLAKEIGCKSVEDASLILWWATNGEYTEPKQYRASEAAAQAVYQSIICKVSQTDKPIAYVLAVARDEKQTSESFV